MHSCSRVCEHVGARARECVSMGVHGCARALVVVVVVHSKPKNVFLHIFCVRMCEKCVIKCLFGTHGVTNVFHYRKIKEKKKKKCYKNVPLTLCNAYSHIPNSMCFICVNNKSLKPFRCHIYLQIKTLITFKLEKKTF